MRMCFANVCFFCYECHISGTFSALQLQFQKGPKTTKSRAPNSLRSLEEVVVSGYFLPRCFLEECTGCLRRAEIRVCWWGEQMFITDISSDYGQQSQITELEHVAAKSSKQFG